LHKYQLFVSTRVPIDLLYTQYSPRIATDAWLWSGAKNGS
jgi:hypothetical protein